MIRNKIPNPWLINWENLQSVELYSTDFLGLQEYDVPDDLEPVRKHDLKLGDLVFALRDVFVGYSDFGAQTAHCKGLYPCTVVEENRRLWLKTMVDRTPSSPAGAGFLDRGTLLPFEEPMYKRRLLALPHLKS